MLTNGPQALDVVLQASVTAARNGTPPVAWDAFSEVTCDRVLIAWDACQQRGY